MRSDGTDSVALENPRIVEEQARIEVEGKGVGEGRREKGKQSRLRSTVVMIDVENDMDDRVLRLLTRAQASLSGLTVRTH